MRPARLGNRKLNALRKEPLYEAIMIDLYLIGALEKDVVEQLLGRSINDGLVSPVKDEE